MPDFMYKEMPASNWNEAVPLGNGNIGALLFGGIFREKMVLNHERLFNYSKTVTPGPVHEIMGEIRRLILNGSYKEAEELYKKSIKESEQEPLKIDPYQPFAFMFIGQSVKKVFTDYSFKLDLKKACTEISWKEGDVTLKRSTFISYDMDYICICLEADKKGYINARVNLEGGSGSKGLLENTLETDDNFLVYKAKYPNGANHGAVAYMKNTGGIKYHDDNNIRIKDADKVYIFVKMYLYEDDKKAVSRIKKEIVRCDYYSLFRAHVKKWKQLYCKLVLDISQSSKPVTNEKLLSESYNKKASNQIIHTMFNYGRYLLISSSKNGGLPANLQGIWNGDYSPAWASDYHLDENIQMNYWLALPSGLNNCMMPFYDYFDSYIEDYKENAKRIYNARGILLPLAQTTHGKTDSYWISAAGWIAAHYFDYWLYTADDDFLKNRAIPYMQEVIEFYEDYLKDDECGNFVFVPSYSPENTPSVADASSMCINATMDVAIAKEVLGNMITACEYLNIKKEDIAKWKNMLKKMPEYMINEDSAFKEWLHEDLKDNYNHRHQSHIYPLFPGFEITKENDLKNYDAIAKAVEKRLLVGFSDQTGWSYAHMANIFARLENKERAYECLSNLIRSCVKSNLFTFHNDWRGQGVTTDWFVGNPPFQIDANFGFTAAVLEMLIFSKPGFIRILPAIAPDWDKGRVKGLCTRCACVVDIDWDLVKKNISVKLAPLRKTSIEIEIPMGFNKIDVNGCIVTAVKENRYVIVNLEKDQHADLHINI